MTGASDQPSARDLLEQAVEGGFYPVDYIAHLCPWLEPLRGDPRFGRILDRAMERAAAFTRDG